MSAIVSAGISPADLLSNARLATDTARALLDLATLSVRRLVSIDGKLSAALLEQEGADEETARLAQLLAGFA